MNGIRLERVEVDVRGCGARRRVLGRPGSADTTHGTSLCHTPLAVVGSKSREPREGHIARKSRLRRVERKKSSRYVPEVPTSLLYDETGVRSCIEQTRGVESVYRGREGSREHASQVRVHGVEQVKIGSGEARRGGAPW